MRATLIFASLLTTLIKSKDTCTKYAEIKCEKKYACCEYDGKAECTKIPFGVCCPNSLRACDPGFYCTRNGGCQRNFLRFLEDFENINENKDDLKEHVEEN